MTSAQLTDTAQKPATGPIVAQHEQVLATLPFEDRQDFEDARRGFVAALEPGVVRSDGRVVWDNDSYGFLTGEAPPTVNPSLWRQSALSAVQGLFEVVPGIYQVRGLDLSNMTIVEGERGVLVIDPLVSAETAAAALGLYRQHRGNRPVSGLLYTHSHVDHFGGVHGVLSAEEIQAGLVPILAPEGFTEHAVSENVYAGTAMARRAGYMYGAALDRGPRGQVGAGLGQTASTGTIGLVPPTVAITTTGQQETIDGIRMVFQMAPGAEAPAELHIYFPQHRAFCAAENATHNLHNILTLRGAVVRDPHAWAGYLTEAIDLFGAELEVVFASHHWPTWGSERAVEFLALQRDLYAYLHDQTLRMLNQGLTGAEIAEAMVLPPALERAWCARGYYGSVSHNVKAIYQRYMGWYDGNPAHLWPHPPAEAGRRYVELMGGADTVVAKARDSFDAGDFRWAAEVLNHVVFADPDHQAARELLADTYEQLGYGAENGTWRCVYLSGAHELRHGNFGTPTVAASPDVLAQLTPEQLFDALAIRIDGPRCGDEKVAIDVDLSDTGTRYRLALRNGALTYTGALQTAAADAVLHLPSTALSGLLARGVGPEQLAAAGVQVDGDVAAVSRLLAALDEPDPDFAIVTP
ncbi:alkyl/aryl-sulfatase [Geodermatophilus sabuli]|uniref:Linear primary-alkylsulfatase n=1 Tax=Geodermatophilus sabuli TaxID=1564158 RepID=A0A285EF42_9ACTN|nr:alkyl sulfatase dimerization domain-containing protein [Geodermatophilus sabuli]MBB3086301.1 alkyl sulfatase BDS1-like metallo-beta-lactamase superfamily hydrolase [Geodermatophilus sabuli]SNX97483.1 Alkyl sulfatase BDS1, metallo-beta-lactamase superfamily [Geodermatophilus sabuli]